jgi:hypothetical protein
MLKSDSHIRASDRARHSGLRGPEAPVAVPDVPGRHQVCISLESASHTVESTPALPVGRLPVVTPGAATASIAGVDALDLNPPKRRFVAHQVPQTGEAPRMEPSAAGRAPDLDSLPQVREVLEDDRVARLARADQLRRQLVVAVEAETCQPALETPEVPPGRAGAFRLEPASERQGSFFDGPPRGFSKIASQTADRRTADAAVDPDGLSHGNGILHLATDRHVEKPALGPAHELRRRRLETPELLGMAIEPDGDLDPAADHRQTGLQGRPVEPVGTGVEADRGILGPGPRHATPLLLKSPGARKGLDRLHAGGNDELTGEIQGSPEGVVGLFVETGTAQALRRPAGFRDRVEGQGVLPDRRRQGLPFTGVQDQSQPSRLLNEHPRTVLWVRAKIGHTRSRRFLPGPKSGVSAACVG